MLYAITRRNNYLDYINSHYCKYALYIYWGTHWSIGGAFSFFGKRKWSPAKGNTGGGLGPQAPSVYWSHSLCNARQYSHVDKDYGNNYDGSLGLRAFPAKCKLLRLLAPALTVADPMSLYANQETKCPILKKQLNTCTNGLSNSLHGSTIGVPQTHCIRCQMVHHHSR